MAGKTEVEVKLGVGDLAAIRKRLARLKARPGAAGRVHEMNYLFDTPQGGLAKHGQLLRIRVAEPERGAARTGRVAKHSGNSGMEAVLTYKGPSELPGEAQPSRIQNQSQSQRSLNAAAPRTRRRQGRYKVREEIEVGVADPGRLKAIFEALGLRGWFRYEKYRTSYQLPASLRWAKGLEILLDETPIGNFLELEGPPEAIDQAAALLGYSHSDHITKSYLQLYLDQCRKQGLPASDMVFAPKNSAKK